MTAPVDHQQQADLWLDEWRKKLRRHRTRIKSDPQFLPVKQLAFEISRGLEKGNVARSDLSLVTRGLCDEALLHRATMMRRRLGETDEGKVLADFERLVQASTQNNDEPGGV